MKGKNNGDAWEYEGKFQNCVSGIQRGEDLVGQKHGKSLSQWQEGKRSVVTDTKNTSFQVRVYIGVFCVLLFSL